MNPMETPTGPTTTLASSVQQHQGSVLQPSASTSTGGNSRGKLALTGLQTQITNNLNSLTQQIKALDTKLDDIQQAFNLRFQKIEASIQENIDLLAVHGKQLLALKDVAAPTFDALKGAINAVKEEVPPVDPAALSAVSSIIHKTVRYLYNCPLSPPVPYPSNDDWPTFPRTSLSLPAVRCLRFDFEQPASHPHNAIAFDTVMHWLRTSDRQNWPGSADERIAAAKLGFGEFEVALKKYFGNLKRDWTGKQLAGGDAVPGVSVVDKRSSEAARRKALSLAVTLRRPFSVYAGEQYEVLDLPHSQLLDDGKERFEQVWMSQQNREMLNVILKTSLPSGTKGRGVKTTNLDLPQGNHIQSDPVWPKASDSVEQQLQEWQFDATYIANHSSAHRNKIVPVNVPTSFSAVRQLPWFKSQPVRTKRERGTTVDVDARSDVDDGNDFDVESLAAIEGLDERSRSRSRSPVKPDAKRIKVAKLSAKLQDAQQHLASVFQSEASSSSSVSRLPGNQYSNNRNDEDEDDYDFDLID